MKDSGRPMQGVPVLIGVIAAMLSGQILKGYQIGLISRIFITIVVAVVFWYVVRLFNKRNDGGEKE